MHRSLKLRLRVPWPLHVLGRFDDALELVEEVRGLHTRY